MFFMKKIYLFLCFFATWGCIIGATDDNELFTEATALYKQGSFQQALDGYQKITHKNRNVYFNQGNCAFKLQQYGKAFLFWRRAERDWGFSSRQELNDNIELVMKKTNQYPQLRLNQGPLKALASYTNHLKTWYGSFIRATPLLFFQIFFLALWALFFIALKWLKQHRRGASSIMIVVIYLTAALLLASKYNQTTKIHGVVTVKEAALYSGPGTTYEYLGKLDEATEIDVQRESDGYYKIKTISRFGWIAKESVDVI